jgi:thioredoxin reductase (NADPH)
MANRVLQHPKIQLLWNAEVTEVQGTTFVESVQLKNTETGETSFLPLRGLFVAIGHTPNSQFVKDLVCLDSQGYIQTNRKQETSQKGIWSAGDVQDPHYRQAITAAGSGCIAALEIERYLH